MSAWTLLFYGRFPPILQTSSLIFLESHGFLLGLLHTLRKCLFHCLGIIVFISHYRMDTRLLPIILFYATRGSERWYLFMAHLGFECLIS